MPPPSSFFMLTLDILEFSLKYLYAWIVNNREDMLRYERMIR